MAKTNWEEKFSVLKKVEYKFANNKEWKFSLEEHKEKGTLQINARMFTVSEKEGGYSGPSKNGFIIPITSVEDFDNVINCFKEFTTFAEGCKEFI